MSGLTSSLLQTVKAALLLCVLAAAPCFATVYVDLNAPVGANDGSTWANACLTVQAGLDASASGEEIWVAGGTYPETIVLGSGDVLYGGFEGYGGAQETDLTQRDWEANVATLDASGIAAPNHVVTMASVQNVRLDGFTVTGGRADQPGALAAEGGGIYAASVTGTNVIANCTITENSASTPEDVAAEAACGAGIFCESAAIHFENTTISNNTATGGSNSSDWGEDALGGGLYANLSTLTFTGCTITGNTAAGGDGAFGPTSQGGDGLGGGLCADDSSITVTGGNVGGNAAVYGEATDSGAADGGGLYADQDCTIVLSGAAFHENTARSGAGVSITGDSSLEATDTLIYGNAATASGGGLDLDATASVTLTECTVSSNTASYGAGVYLANTVATLSRCAISGNAATSRGGGLHLYSCSPDIVNSIISGNSAGAQGGALAAYNQASPEIINCTISRNTAVTGGGVYVYLNSGPSLTNTILEGNTGFAIYENDTTANARAQYCLFYDNPDGAFRTNDGSTYADAEVWALIFTDIGGLYAFAAGSPAFVMDGADAITGTWTTVSTVGGVTTLTDASAAFTPGALAGAHLQANTGERLQAFIIDNDATSVTVQGDVTSYASAGDAYAIVDYHIELTSAALDTGQTESTVSEDFDGMARPALNEYDIGAFEYPCEGVGLCDIETDPSALAFGSWPAGQHESPAQAAVIINLGADDLTVTSAALTGDDAADFTIVRDSGESLLSTGAMRTLQVAFVPASLGAKTAALTITSDDLDEPTVEIPISGTGAGLSVIRVDQDAPGPVHDGSTWETAYLTIQAGLDASSPGDDVWVAGGAYTEAIMLDDGDILYGGFEGYGGAGETSRAQRDWETNETIIDGSTADAGGAADHVVYASGASAIRLDGFTVTGGNADGEMGYDQCAGGIILLAAQSSNTIANCLVEDNQASMAAGGIGAVQSSLTLEDCVIRSNTSAYVAGGAASALGWLVLSGCTVTDNNAAGELGTSGLGGGVCWMGDTQAAITDSVISANAAADGGAGLLFVSCPGTIAGCTITNNVATDGDGAGVYALAMGEFFSTNPSLEMTDSLLASNTAFRGGGIAAEDVESAVIRNCSFFENTAQGGGAISLPSGGAATLTGCTVEGNTVTGQAGGVSISADSVSITQCTLANNTAGDIGGALLDAINGGNMTNCVITGNAGSTTGGLCLESCTMENITLQHCTIAGNTGAGLRCEDTHTMRNSIFEGNSTCAITEAYAAADPTVENCLFHNNAGGAYVDYDTSTVYADADIDDLNTDLAEASGNITGAPLFAASAQGDYHITAASPAVDAGVDTALSTDRDGWPRPVDLLGVGADGTGTEYDIGAYEVQQDAQIALTPATLDFGECLVNQGSATRSVTLSNVGASPLQITSITLSGSGAFAFAGPPDTSTLDAGASREIQIAFDPTAIGSETGTLTVESSAAQNPTAAAALTGEGLNQPPLAGTSPSGSALDFDGVDDELNAGTQIDLANESFSWSFWANRASIGTRDWILSLGSSGTNLGLHIGFRYTDYFSFAFYGDDLNSSEIYTETNEWHHWAGTYDASTRQRILYRDGAVVDSDIAAANFTGSGTFRIAARWGGMNFHGGLDEVRLWKGTVRTQAQIQAAMYHRLNGDEAGLEGYWRFDEGSGSTALDSTSNGNDAAFDGAPAWVTPSTSPMLESTMNYATDEEIDLVVTLAGYDPDGDSLTAHISSLPAVGYGTVYQYDGGARGALIDAADTPVTDAQMRVVYAPAQRDLPYEGSFGWKVHDGLALSELEGTVEVDVTADDEGPPTATVALATPSPTWADDVVFDVTFSEPVAPSFGPEEVTLSGGLTGAVTIGGTDPVYTVTVSLTDPDLDGTIGIALLAGDIQDETGNPYAGGDASGLCTIANLDGFLEEPQSARKYEGESHTFTATADCSATTLTYQWKWDDGAKTIHDVGDDSTTYAIADVTGQGGDYWCEVLYAGATFSTGVATLAVAPVLTIEHQPLGGEYYTGDSHTFSVSVNGGFEPLEYTWRKGGDVVASGATYTINPLDATCSGSYSVTVMDDNGAIVQSDEVGLLVHATGMPASGALGLTLLTLVSLAIGVRSTLRRRRTPDSL